jgi:hypothetical protein
MDNPWPAIEALLALDASVTIRNDKGQLVLTATIPSAAGSATTAPTAAPPFDRCAGCGTLVPALGLCPCQFEAVGLLPKPEAKRE